MSTLGVKQEEQARRKQSQATTVLVVEDFEETRFMLKLSMELSGYRVAEATNGQQAVEVARRESPDIILMDIGLPVMDGCQATRLIREDKALRNVPIVAVSANATAEYRVNALAAGCDEYVTKPIDFDSLKKLIGHFAPPNRTARRDRSSPTRAHTKDQF